MTIKQLKSSLNVRKYLVGCQKMELVAENVAATSCASFKQRPTLGPARWDGSVKLRSTQRKDFSRKITLIRERTIPVYTDLGHARSRSVSNGMM